MAADYSAEIKAITDAIASGATRVSYDNKSVEYDSFEKMLARRAWLERQQAGGKSANGSAGFASFDRGDV